MYARIFKRWFDFIAAFAGIVILSPVYLVLAVMVLAKLGRPVLFRQERPGKNEKIFKLYKFRTMTDARNEQGELLPDGLRLPRFGKFLRTTSLDELPELFNILKGEMSFIGPRPLLVSYLPFYSEREKRRHTVRPGLTGLAQVSGRNYLDWDARMAKDVEYVDRLSLMADLRIIGATISTVLGRSHEVAADTNAAEGNFAEIRRERLARTGKLKDEKKQ